MRTKLIATPLLDLQKLERAGCRDIAVARIVLGLFDSIVGVQHERIFLKEGWRFSLIQSLPRRLRGSAAAVFGWGSQQRIVLNDVLRAQYNLTAAVFRMYRNSPYGRRRVRIANQIRIKFPPRSPDELRAVPNVEVLPVLGNEVGRPLGPRVIRHLQALSPEYIEVLRRNEWSCAVRPPRSARIDLEPDGYTIAGITIAAQVEEAPRSPVIRGELVDYFETGTEGVVWSVSDDDDQGYSGLHVIKEGDHLTILDRLGHELWRGVIRFDRKIGWQRYSGSRTLGQPSALGHWIHWTQRGFKADDWAKFFIRPDYDRLKALLRKRTD